MAKEEFIIERPADEFSPERSFTVTAKTFVPDNEARAVRVQIWGDAHPSTGHTVTKADFALSLQERKNLIAFLSALPDADFPF